MGTRITEFASFRTASRRSPRHCPGRGGVTGAAEQILAYAEDIGQRWLQGIGVARLLNERRAKPKPT